MNAARLTALINTAVDGIIFIDAQGAITLFNPACERLFGYRAGEMVGQNVKQLMPAPDHAAHDGYVAAYRRTGERKIIGVGREVLGRRKDGETFPIELSVGEAALGGEVFFVGILRDITERRRAADQREQLIEALTASNEERAHFTHAASHDLREPLRMITAFCSLLTQDYGGGLDARGRDFLGLVVSAAGRMETLLDDLVQYGQLSEQHDRSVWFSAGDCLDQAQENLLATIGESGARIDRGPLPRLYGNPVRFVRLMQNLLGNAVKYVAPGVQPHVRVRAHAEAAFWRFHVCDNGIGVEPRHHQQIFEPFKRLHGRAAYAGNGLGLSICRKIVEGFGGEIAVRSAPPGGSTFSFTVRACGEENHDVANEP